ncbi:MAG: hypothetical protein WBB43_20445 [Limnoraphis sp.]
MISIEQLTQAEQQIQSLLTQNESNWKAIAKIAIVVQQQELFKQAELNSFTAWVNAVAKKCDCLRHATRTPTVSHLAVYQSC